MFDSRRGLTLVFLLALVALNLALFLPAMRGGFIWDDHYFIGSNPLVTGPHFLRNFLAVPYGGYSGSDAASREEGRSVQFYRPLVSLSYWIDYQIWGMNPAAFHLTNILLHAGNVILLYLILTGLGIGAAAAFLAGLLFCAYPPHVENVAWISGRPDLLAFFFAALSAFLFIKHTKNKRNAFLFASGGAFLLSLLSKESAILLPAVFLIGLISTGEKGQRLARLMAPFAGAAAVWLVLRFLVLGLTPLHPAGAGMTGMLAVLGFYGFRSLVPFGLSVTVDALPVLRSVPYAVAGTGMTVAAIIALVLVFRRKASLSRSPWPAWAAFFLLLIPSLYVLASTGAVSLVAWRFLYLSSAVLCGSVAFWLWAAFRKKWVPVAMIGLLTAAFALEAIPKIGLYGSQETNFWLGIRPIGREDGIARIAIAARLLESDEAKALAVFDTVLAETGHPCYSIWRPRVLEILARHFTAKGDFERAGHYFRELFRSRQVPSSDASFDYADYLARTGKREEAGRIVGDLLRDQPANHAILIQAARYYIARKEFGRARELLQKDYDLFRGPETLTLLQALARETPK